MKKHSASKLKPCQECGMYVKPDDYHPFAACLMYKACQDYETVEANLAAVLSEGMKRWKAFVEEGIEA